MRSFKGLTTLTNRVVLIMYLTCIQIVFILAVELKSLVYALHRSSMTEMRQSWMILVLSGVCPAFFLPQPI